MPNFDPLGATNPVEERAERGSPRCGTPEAPAGAGHGRLGRPVGVRAGRQPSRGGAVAVPGLDGVGWIQEGAGE